MKLSPIRQFKGNEELLRVLTNPEEYAEHLRQLKALEDAINAKLGLVESLEAVDQLRAQATAQLALVTKARAQLDQDRQQADQEIAQRHAKAREESNTLIAEAQALLERAHVAEQAAQAREIIADHAMAEAHQLRRHAEELMAKADALRVEYERRLSALQEAMR